MVTMECIYHYELMISSNWKRDWALHNSPLFHYIGGLCTISIGSWVLKRSIIYMITESDLFSFQKTKTLSKQVSKYNRNVVLDIVNLLRLAQSRVKFWFSGYLSSGWNQNDPVQQFTLEARLDFQCYLVVSQKWYDYKVICDMTMKAKEGCVISQHIKSVRLQIRPRVPKIFQEVCVWNRIESNWPSRVQFKWMLFVCLGQIWMIIHLQIPVLWCIAENVIETCAQPLKWMSAMDGQIVILLKWAWVDKRRKGN